MKRGRTKKPGRDVRGTARGRIFWLVRWLHNRWVVTAALLALLLALRVPWLDADGGNEGFWTYGFFCTDEGIYTSGGRLAYLTGKFLDPAVDEPTSFVYAWGMNLLAWLAYVVAGLSFVAPRLPTLAIAVCAWLTVYRLLSRSMAPWMAGLLVAVVSSNPVSLTFERVASTDVVIGGLVVFAIACAVARPWLAVFAGAFLAFALSVKSNALGLLPLLVFVCFSRRRTRWQRIGFLAAGLIVVFAALLLVRNHLIADAFAPDVPPPYEKISPDAPQEGLLAFEPRQWLVALSIFPRWPVSLQLGPLLAAIAILFCMMPLAVALLDWRRLQTPRMAVPLGGMVYLLLLSVQIRSSLRYFLP
ncbi:MAG: hypothetical protein N3B01_11945, partial [Verrucomicrobiae bacterium]|nr:hypothetical protein [Verrucomicrobiae bacterium]